jgi:hypothetical protein
LGSGILKILPLPQLLHDKVFNLIGFFCDSFKPGLGFLLRCASFDNAAVINDASSGVETVFASIRLSDSWWALILSVEGVRL